MTIILCIYKCYSITNLEAQLLSGLIFGFSIYQSKLNEIEFDHILTSLWGLCGRSRVTFLKCWTSMGISEAFGVQTQSELHQEWRIISSPLFQVILWLSLSLGQRTDS